VPVHDYGEEDGQPYLVMRYMAGGSLEDRIQSGLISLAETSRIINRLAPALDYAHAQGVVHRDLKPGNILFDQHNEPYVADFGIVKLKEATTTLTGNTIVGTPAYMSPEQGRGRSDIDGRADIYSLGAILFQMLSGRLPYEADTPTGQIIAHITEPVPNLLALRPDLPPGAQAVIERSMAKKREERYASVQEMATALVDLRAAFGEGDEIRIQSLPTPARRTESPESVTPDHTVAPGDRPLKDFVLQPGESQQEDEDKTMLRTDLGGLPPAGECVPGERPRTTPALQVQSLSPTWSPGARRLLSSSGRLAWIIILAVLALIAIGVALTAGVFAVNRGLAGVAATKTAVVEYTADALASLQEKSAVPSPTQSEVSTSPAPLPSRTLAPLPSSTPVPSSTTTPAPTNSPTPILTPLPTLGIGSTMVSDTDGMVLVYVPAGEFQMGSADSDTEASSNEKPQHAVYLDAFWIDSTEVTNGMYALCVTASACQPPVYTSSYTRASYYGDSQYDAYPVIYVSWNDAAAYCEWAGRRLPTEAEWEKAARGTDGRLYPWGSASPDANLLNFNDNVGDTTAVGSYPSGASPYGALDMAGNVWEWVADWYSETYYASSPFKNPSGSESGSYRVLRGGSWGDSQWIVRSALRLRITPVYRDFSVGFRCVRSP